jgi:hypothetical protein
MELNVKEQYDGSKTFKSSENSKVPEIINKLVKKNALDEKNKTLEE